MSVRIPAHYAPEVAVLRLKACQDGACTESTVELHPGSASIDQGCTPEGVCSATASPDGTKFASLLLKSLTEAPMSVTAWATGPDGLPLPAQNLDVLPRGHYPFGKLCGRFINVSVLLDADGLHALA